LGNNGEKHTKKGKREVITKLGPASVWSHNYDQVCFNGAPEGKKTKIYRLDLKMLFKNRW